jgi:hypothetical protein
MSERNDLQAAATEAVEKAEAAATRRRWINLGEFVAVAGLIIAAVSLWLSWADHSASEADKASSAAEKSLVTYTAAPTKGGAVLTLSDPDHRIQQIDVAFPPSLGVGGQSVIEPHISAKWFDAAILKATDGGSDKRSGRLPVLITTTWLDGGRRKVDRAIYQIAWRTGGRLFQGRTLDLDGAILAERGGSPARLDALWKAEKPGK